MNKLDELLEIYCPSGVRYDAISELIKKKDIITVTPTLKLPKSEYKETGISPIVSQEEEIISGFCEYQDPKIIQRQYVCFGDHSEHIKYIDFSFVQGADGLKILYTNSDVVLPKYLYYALSSCYKKKNTYERHYKYLQSTLIPLPPLVVQEEIVRILDDYSEKNVQLIDALNDELEARKVQYEYYRGEIFASHAGYQYFPLGEVCKLITGATPNTSKREYWDNGDIPWMSSGEVNSRFIYNTENKISQKGYDNTSTTIVPIHTVVIALAGQGKTRGKVAITEIELCTNQSLCSMLCGPKIYYKYLFHYLESKYWDLRSISNGNGSRGGLSLKLLSPYKIPVPPIEVQKEIVRILDDYSEKNAQLIVALHNELQLRKIQYEYYRDKLLTFKKAT